MKMGRNVIVQEENTGLESFFGGGDRRYHPASSLRKMDFDTCSFVSLNNISLSLLQFISALHHFCQRKNVF